MSAIVMAPLDGSPAAEAALPWAVHLARGLNGSIRLVGVHAPPAVLLDGETLVGSVVPDESIRRQETDYFANVQTLLKPTGVPVAADLLDGGVVSSLAEYARTLKPAWIVMMSHARGAVARFFLGETASEFVRRSPCPVLLVHPAAGPVDPAAEPDVREVLIPLDGSELAERILAPAADFAKAVRAGVTLLMAPARLPDIPPAKAEAYLEQKATGLRSQSLAVQCKTVPKGESADVIVAQAEAHPGTIVALATHGRGGLAKLVWGSVAEDVVRRTHAPVLVFKPSKE
jgi:nucleotide-binding universal stress UspA family protein